MTENSVPTVSTMEGPYCTHEHGQVYTHVHMYVYMYVCMYMYVCISCLVSFSTVFSSLVNLSSWLVVSGGS